MVFGALAGAGLSAGIGAINSHQATKKNRAARARGQGVLDQLLQSGAYYGGQQEDILLQRLGLLGEGYDNARLEVGRIGAQSKRDIRERGQTRTAGLQSQAIRSGLSSSTTPMVHQGYSDSLTSREIAGVDESLAGIHAGLITQGAQSQASALGDLANFYGLQYNREADIEGKRFGLFTGQYFTPQPGPDLGGLSQGLGDLYEGLFGGTLFS